MEFIIYFLVKKLTMEKARFFLKFFGKTVFYVWSKYGTLKYSYSSATRHKNPGSLTLNAGSGSIYLPGGPSTTTIFELSLMITGTGTYLPVLRIWIRCLFDPWIRDPGWVKIRIRDEQPRSYISESLEPFLGG
jgi:hypothetical protein